MSADSGERESGAPMLVHATCVAIGGAGLLLRGAPGSGKSDLALRLIDAGAELVADDQVVLERRGDRLWAAAPQALRGLIEVRGIGIVRLPWRDEAPLAAVFDLGAGAVARLPEPACAELAGVALPLFALRPFEASAPAKVRLALRGAAGMLGTWLHEWTNVERTCPVGRE